MEFFESRGHHVSVLVGSDDLKPEIRDYEVVPKKGGEHWRERLSRYKDSIERTRPDFVYTVSGIEELDVLRFLQVPRASHIFSLERHRYVDVQELIRQVGPYVEILTVNTMDVLEQIDPRSIPQVKGMVVPYRLNGVFLDLPPIAQAARQRDELEVCFVGRLETVQKRVHWLPRIIDECSKTGARFHWHIYGTGPAEALIVSDIKRQQNENFVHFHGWQDSASLAAGLRDHDIFFLCSQWEGLPVAMVEAMSCGLACVVPCISPGIKFILAKGGGWTYDATSPEAAVKALTSAAKDPELLWRRRIEAQKVARAMFGDETVSRYLQAMETAFSKTVFNGRFLNLSKGSKMQMTRFSNRVHRPLSRLFRRLIGRETSLDDI
ncbi:MAG TPA: glycosyltransferase family 4 protein [Verrucomicrobiae bacterium]|nr:glycosyltransferase family 4 protein [Verrucomicrobiae bacterium]